MKLSRQDFETRYANGTLRLAFIGMSNIGKSYTAGRLAKRLDFKLIEIDKLIWEELGHSDMDAFATWQGQPYSDGYAEREKESIRLETKATIKAIAMGNGNIILDTPGSVIYTGQATLAALKKTHFIVYIAASDERMESLVQDYFETPKPLIWRDLFHQEIGQSPDDAILSSYPKLLADRSKQYESIADQTLTSNFILNPQTSIEAIFENLKPTR